MTNPMGEERFEAAICDWLVGRGGYDVVKNDLEEGEARSFDLVHGIDAVELFVFIGATQMEHWDRLIAAHGGDPSVAQAKFRERLASALDKRGVVDVLRRGVYDRGVTIQLAYFRPASGLTPERFAEYEANRLTVTRQLRYEAGSNKAVDLALFVNGILVATAELKNPTTGQGVEEAIAQYRTDRDPRNRTLRRAVVHFAVDPERVAMTTRLAGRKTRFLPFNQGHDMGAGNPPNPSGHATAYLWEHVWQRDAWLDLLGRFVHVEKPMRGSRQPGKVIFPRYHQWDAVLQLEAAAREEGTGHSYLVQHSAGSGKSNTIAWLAYRLATLHRGDDTKVFDKVVVITDRVVLDRQLQDTIFQFEHAHGLVERIEKSSQQLADALSGEQARIVITTLQKFPFVLDKLGDLPDRSYAIVIDEAHSSQTGKAADDLKRALRVAQRPDSDDGAGDRDDGDLAVDEVEDALADTVAVRGPQPNLSFFAFTATPKGKTLEKFGRYNPAVDKHEPFHLYAMRQAIEEGFIHDVLASYTTYETFFRLAKAIPDDPRYETAEARRAIARYVHLHEHNLSQKADIVAEHFQAHVRHKIGGKAKAMVVCSSRQHAVRFWTALRDRITHHGYDLEVLVAFSGEVRLNGDDPVTESKCNGFPASQTAERFDTDQHQLLVVAEKFQTGFDQPKLYAIYVDKPLSRLAAVQTLSRLNRTHPDKDGTFVLDFVNDTTPIVEGFERYHGKTVAPPSDPNLLYDSRHALDEYGVLDVSEATTFARLLLVEGADHGRLYAALRPAIDRFHGLDDDEQDRFRDALARFVRVYGFVSQIVSFTDTELERDCLFAEALQAFVKADAGVAVDLSGDVELTHLRTEQRFSGSLSLDADVGDVGTVFSGTGPQHEPAAEALSVIIEEINAQHGTDWTRADQVVLELAFGDLIADPEVQLTAVNSTPENFAVVFPELFQKALLGRMDRNEKVVFRFLDDPALAADVVKMYVTLAQARLRVAYQEHCPIGELLESGGESAHLEYKSTLRTGAHSGEVYKPLETQVVKTVAAFANSEEGGTLLIGIADDGTVHGLAGDYASVHRDGKDDRDQFLLHLHQVLINAMGKTVASQVSAKIHTLNGDDVCRVHVPPSSFPVEATVVVDKRGQMLKKTAFYIRIGNRTEELTDPADRQRHIARRWASGVRGGR